MGKISPYVSKTFQQRDSANSVWIHKRICPCRSCSLAAFKSCPILIMFSTICFMSSWISSVVPCKNSRVSLFSMS